MASDLNPTKYFKLKLLNRRTIQLKEYIANVYISYGFFIIGNLLTTIVTLVGKKAIGRLRPNFLSVCKPDINPYSICGLIHQTGNYSQYRAIHCRTK